MTTTLRLFTVTVQTEIVVLAETAKDAEIMALEEADDLEGFGAQAAPMRYYPAEWEDDSIPFGEQDPEDPDRSLKDWVELGAAPDLEKKAQGA